MEINIRLPEYEYSENKNYASIKSYLKQLELCVHHAQKSVESAEKEGIEITDNSYVNFKHPGLERLSSDNDTPEVKSELDNFTDNYYEQLQSIELSIYLG